MQVSLAKQSRLLLGSMRVNGEVMVGIILARCWRGIELEALGLASDAVGF